MNPVTNDKHLKGERVIHLQKHTVYVYRTSVLAYYLRRTSECIRAWRSKGIVPPPVLTRTSDKKCLYLADEINIYVALVDRYSLSSGTQIPNEFTAQAFGEMKALRAKIGIALREGRDPNQELFVPRLPEFIRHTERYSHAGETDEARRK